MIDIYNLLEDMTIFEAILYYRQGMIVECADGKVIGLHMAEKLETSK